MSTSAPPEGIAPAITLTKLQRPRVGRRLVARPRLLEHLDAAQSLTLVLAPAGGGKTTLLSTWLETCDLPYAWLALEERDNDLGLFASYLIRALRTLFPVVDNALAAVSGATTPPPGAIARTLLNDLATVEQDFVLVLDDYQVIRNQAIHDLMTEIVLHPPRTLRLFIAARQDPPLPLAALRARGDVMELRKADLWFTSEETRQFLVESMRLTLDERAIAGLIVNTQGWPVGLRLAALYLRQQQATGLAADAPGQNRYVMDYLAAEVLAHLPLAIQEFLLKSSLLDRLCGPLCEAVTGMAETMASGQPILEWLEYNDLFVTPVDDQRRWYRFHDLFRQFLGTRLEQQYGPPEIAALRLQASAWYAANGALDEALEHAVAAGDMAAAVRIIAQHRQGLTDRSQWQRMDRWLHLFPREVIDEQPHLLLLEIWLKFNRQQQGETVVLLDRVEALLSGLPPEIGRPLQGEAKVWRSGVLYWSSDFARSMTNAQQALVEVPPQYVFLRGYAHLYLSGGSITSGDLTRAFAELYATGEPDQGREHQQFLFGLACYVHWITADLAGLGRAARQALANDLPDHPAASVTWSQFYLGACYYQRNELADAEKYLQPLVAQPYLSQANCFLNSAVLLARIRQRQGQPEEAQQIAQVMTSFALEMNSEVLLLVARALQAELAWRQGRLAEASQWAAQRAAQSGTSWRVPLPYPYVPSLVLARILVAQNTLSSRQQARELLTQLDDYYGSIHFTAIHISLLALLALLHSAEGDEPQALAALSRSIALAEPGGFIRLFVDLGLELKPLLRKLAQQGVSPRYLADLLAAFEAEDARPPAGQPARTEPASSGSTLLTNREQEVLELLASRATDKEIAEALVISPRTVSSHIDHLGDKLGARGRRAIVAAAKAQGLLT